MEKILSFVTMTVLQSAQGKINNQKESKVQDDPILCPHCKRTASNGIRCKGICVADSDY